MVYLIHFDRKFKHARHYMGATAALAPRMKRHREGGGSRLLRAVSAAGIRYRVVRTWPGRFLKEQKLKRIDRKRLCPVCSGRAALKVGR